MSARIRVINASPALTFWTLEMAPPAVFTETAPINKTITYDGSIIGGGISPLGDAIYQIRIFVDINALPVYTFLPAGVIEDGKSYAFDLETGILSEEAGRLNRVLPFAAVVAVIGIVSVGLVTSKKRTGGGYA